ncbi:MAG: Stage V sporulation protein D [Candidatus Roizmanbacteria bacterium GW2011_GWA2_36_23]|uniref:Stage V sporulation protein D n=1 Tax=Candidatus Roizmanbacteria bacterium GW2011_GWA2_36_23 TaxID=1618480 RepID=A0A0G0E8S3_9BACT|nr:MAG: Stage V sporulation protein D [Candidatus Roizmanbacteria bacterium GW2011_GWA2_36_23]
MSKAKFLYGIFLTSFLLVIVKLFFTQIITPQSVTVETYLKTKQIIPERGSIFDRNRNPLVLNQNSYLLYVEPKKIQDKALTVKKLSSVLEIEEASLEAKIDDSKYWISIKSGIEEDRKKSIEKLGLKGLGFEYAMKRYYPEASLSAHIVGFVGKNTENEDIGYFGIEGFYDKDLKGLPGILESERDLFGKPMIIGMQEKVNPEHGRDLILTIDKTVQEISKRKLLQGLDSYKAKEGCVVTANPKTMEILAMVCLPDYDPSKYFLFDEKDFKNPILSDLYEPGSTFKPLIVAAALQEKKIRADDFYDEKGSVEVGEYRIKTWNDKYEGKITITRILEKSSNVGMVHIGNKLGNDLIYSYLKKYGFGEKTQIDLQGEIEGYIKPKQDWYPIDYATVTFGQGIAVSPIRMLAAFSSIINGGDLMRPSLVNSMVDADGIRVLKPKLERTILSDMTSAIVKKMLVSTVENGEIKWLKPKGYKIGGKTGTAQIPIKGHYDPSKTIASFIGFAPADDPKFITLVILKEPQSSPWGSETAAPLFFDIAKELIVYYNIAPGQ